MLCAGWVHRDVSAGNILAYRQKDGLLRAKLSDLEYARPFPRKNGGTSGDERIVCTLVCLDNRGLISERKGTPYFMALEILDTAYLFNTTAKVKNSFKRTYENESPETPAVIHNFQHDLEPVWWLVLWLVTDNVVDSPSKEFARLVFQNCMIPSREQRNAFVSNGWLKSCLNDVLKDSLSAFIGDLEELRSQLYSHCIERTMNGKLDDPCSYVKIYNVFSGFFASVSEHKEQWGPEALSRRQVSCKAPTTVDVPVVTNLLSLTEEIVQEESGQSSAPERMKRPSLQQHGCSAKRRKTGR